MRALTLKETYFISAGATCYVDNGISIDMWRSFDEQARHDAFMLSAIAGPAAAGACFYFGAPLLAVIFAGIAVSAIAYHLEYTQSEVWPWNY